MSCRDVGPSLAYCLFDVEYEHCFRYRHILDPHISEIDVHKSVCSNPHSNDQDDLRAKRAIFIAV
jgi:hypothetical protein